MSKRPTIEDVAALVGVSRQTVSRALNNQGRIDAETKRKVLEAVERLGYRPSRFARGLVRQDVITVGVVMPPITNPFFPELVTGIAAAVRAWDGHVLLGVHDDSAEDELRTLRRVHAQADAVIAYVTQDVPEIAALSATLPCVRIDTDYGPSNWPGVDIDYEGGVRLALGRLADTGHREIAMLDAPMTSCGGARREAFLRLAPDHGLYSAGVIECEASFQGGADGVARLLEAHPSVTGVLTFNDVIAVGALRGAQRLGRAVPDDLAVIGFDDLALAEVVSPPLTTVRVNTRQLGELAAGRLKLLLDGVPAADLPPARLSPTLTIRASG